MPDLSFHLWRGPHIQPEGLGYPTIVIATVYHWTDLTRQVVIVVYGVHSWVGTIDNFSPQQLLQYFPAYESCQETCSSDTTWSLSVLQPKYVVSSTIGSFNIVLVVSQEHWQWPIMFVGAWRLPDLISSLYLVLGFSFYSIWLLGGGLSSHGWYFLFNLFT